MQIPSWPVYDERELELLREVLESRQWGGFNAVVSRFEQEFAAYQHCAHCMTAANGTVTLETALAVLGIGPGDEVIVPAISFISTATAVSRVGATPVFVDIGECTFNIDPARAAAAVTPRTKAIIPVHFGGVMADMDALIAIAKDRGLHIIEDAAHAHGSEWRGRRAGSFGVCGSFSFQNSKVLTAGEGGALTSNDEGFATAARSFINQGRREGSGWFHHYTLGTNLRITAWEAAVLLAQLERLPEQIRLREANVRILKEELAGLPGIRLQEVPAAANVNSWYLLLGRIDRNAFGITRDEFSAAMADAGVPCSPYYPHTLYNNPLYVQGGCRVEPCPNAEATILDSFWLPCRALMGDQGTTRAIAAAIRAAASARASTTSVRP